jgi:integrase
MGQDGAAGELGGLLIRSQAGCPDAHRALLTHAAARAHALRPSCSEAEVQQAILRVHGLRHTFRPGSCATSWLETILAEAPQPRKGTMVTTAVTALLARLLGRAA